MKANITKKEWTSTSTDKDGNIVTVATTIITLVAIRAAKEFATTNQHIGDTHAHV